MILTAENYFSPEANMKYMGHSQFLDFKKCEYNALAKAKGDYEEPKTTALLVGGYVDAHFEGTLDVYKAKNPQMFTTKGELKSDYKKAEEAIAFIEKDEMMMKYLSGEKQVIKTGNVFGVETKIKIDSFHDGACIVDLKYMKDFEPMWLNGVGKVHFIEAWGYDIQAAFYQEVEGNNLPFYIVGATKEDIPNKKIIQISQGVIDAAKRIIEHDIHRFSDIKKGLIEPEKCGRCNWCKKNKIIDEIEIYDGWGEEL